MRRMSKQVLLSALMCSIFQVSSAMNTKQPENQFCQFISSLREKSAQQQQEWLDGYRLHLQQKPKATVVSVESQKKDKTTSK